MHENDVFPEEFAPFLRLRPGLREALLTSHGAPVRAADLATLANSLTRRALFWKCFPIMQTSASSAHKHAPCCNSCRTNGRENALTKRMGAAVTEGSLAAIWLD